MVERDIYIRDKGFVRSSNSDLCLLVRKVGALSQAEEEQQQNRDVSGPDSKHRSSAASSNSGNLYLAVWLFKCEVKDGDMFKGMDPKSPS